MPPLGLIYTGGGDFIKQGQEWKEFFIDNGLLPHHHFLDIGSGIGRIAIGLTHYLTGRYQGFEAMEIGQTWCEENITPRFSNFSFTYVPLHNDLYNSSGIDAASYSFEYAKESFDFGCAISVFTHMVDTEVQNYLEQTNKVLQMNGRLVATFFVLDDESRSVMTQQSGFYFQYDKGNYLLMDDKVISANVCFKREYLENIVFQSGFNIVATVNGSWCGRKKTHAVGYQDVWVLEKMKDIDLPYDSNPNVTIM